MSALETEKKTIPQDVVVYSDDYKKLLDAKAYAGKYYEIDERVEEICKEAFKGCDKLEEIVMPKKLKKIDSEAFQGCSSLTKLTLPDSLKSIDGSVFSGCSSLTKLTLPDSLESIGEHAFSDCRGLTELTLPNSLESIGDGAFRGCSELTELILPDSVTSIGNGAFGGCSGLVKITSLAKIPPVCDPEVFDGVNKTNCELIVPEGSVAAYTRAEDWNKFSNIRVFPE